jgi:long-chain acyl-CoA synthetase
MNEKRLFEYLTEQMERCPLEQAFGRKKDGDWQYYSTAQMVQTVNRLSVGLLSLGLRPGDKVATVVYQTTPEWVAFDFALLQIGVLNVPMYPTISTREYAYILAESEARYCVTGDGDLYDKVEGAKHQEGVLLQGIFTFGDHPTARRWDSLLAAEDASLAEVERIKATVRLDDVATLIYTSGTTGNPKGVMLTHRNISFNVEAMRLLLPVSPGDRGLSFLPVSHVFERVAVYAYIAYGMSISFTGTENLGGETGDLQTIRPHFFTCVPRLLEKVYDKIYHKAHQLKGPKKTLFHWAMGLTNAWQFDRQPSGWQAIQWRIAQKLVFSKWRAALGGHVKGIVTGASACPLHIMRVFNAAGIPVREGYGMTEAAPALSFSRFTPGDARLGTVGLALEEVALRIEQDAEYAPGEGEILAKSPGTMEGYYKQPERTAEMIRRIDGERWLATGDVGTLVEDGHGRKFLKITDRKKELLKTSGGKYVAPAPIESRLREHRLVEQVMVVGENLKFVSALIIPATEALRDWCEEHQVTWTNIQEVVQNPRIRERYQALIDRINPNFGHVEQIKKFCLLTSSWEPVKSDGTEAELTPTMKLKRRVIMQKYAAEIESMYA